MENDDVSDRRHGAIETKTVQVSCLCGAVELRLDGEPADQFYCHCDDCQATNGGAYVAAAVYPSHAVTVMQGELKTWTLKTMPRKRCVVCGTQVMADVPGDVGLTGIKADLLPDGEFKPAFHINCRYAVLPVQDDLPHYKGFPAAFGGSDETVDW